MQSFVDIDRTFSGQPPRLGARLARLDVGRGREELYRDQLPELLRALARQTRIESISASSAIEGISVEADRAEKIAETPELKGLRNRDEQEFAGYRDAIDEIVRAEQQERLTVPLILHVHRRLFAYTNAEGGRFKQEDNIIGDRDEYGRVVKLFTPPPWQKTEQLISELVARYNDAAENEIAHPVVLIAAFILDFLAIHPFEDGNGRVARILTTQMLLECGYGVPRYISVEQRILETRNSYYDVLLASQRGWHEREHTIWPWVEYLVATLADAYDTFEQRLSARRGLATMSKQERVRVYVLEHASGEFRVRELRRALPGVSDQTIRLVLGQLRDEGLIEVDGKGPQASWRRLTRAEQRYADEVVDVDTADTLPG